MENIIYKAKNSIDTIAVCSFDDNIEADFIQLENHISSREINDIKSIRNDLFRQQKMAGRLLLNMLLGSPGELEYNEHGKPVLKSHAFDISFTHSKNKVGIMLSSQTAGIDIQDSIPRIRRIVHKYMNEPELGSLNENTYEPHATVYWSAKEALYKAYGERQLIFTENIIIQPFRFNAEGGSFTGSISLPGSKRDFVLNYTWLDEFALVYIWNS